MAGVQQLSDATIRLVGSTQVITSVFSVIKELFENALDASSTSVDIKLENFGLDRIEVRDNGTGVKTADIPVFAKRHYTSKIKTHGDLESLTSYGFRGEALASLCALSEASVTTKTAEDNVGFTYTLNEEGDIVHTSPSHLGQGTTVCVKNLFKNLPVRKQYHNAAKKKKDELKRIEDLLIAYGIICPDVRISLRHNKEQIWQKVSLPDSAAVLQSVLGRQIMSQMEWRKTESTDLEIVIEMCIPKPGADVSAMSRSVPDRSFLCINKRPVTVKEISRLIRQYYCNCHACDNSRHPIYFVSITLPARDVDVNIDPNKTTVMTSNMAQHSFLEKLEEVLLYVYGPLDQVPSWRYRDSDDGKSQKPSCKSKEFSDLNSQVVHCKQIEENSVNKSNNWKQIQKDGVPNCPTDSLSGPLKYLEAGILTESVISAENDVESLSNKSQSSLNILGSLHDHNGVDVGCVEKKNLEKEPDTMDSDCDRVSNLTRNCSHSCSATETIIDVNSGLNSLTHTLVRHPQQENCDNVYVQLSKKIINDIYSTFPTESSNTTARFAEQSGISNVSTSEQQGSSLSSEFGKADNTENQQGSSLSSEFGKADNTENQQGSSLSSEFGKADNTEKQQGSSLSEFGKADNTENQQGSSLSSEFGKADNTEKQLPTSNHASISRKQIVSEVYSQCQAELGKLTGGIETLVRSDIQGETISKGSSQPEAGLKQSFGVDTVTGWSHGTSLLSENGNLVQPVKLLAPSPVHFPGKRPRSPSHDQQMQKSSTPPDRRGKRLCPAQSTLYHMINNTAVKHPMSARDIFFKEQRPQVVDTNPQADYDQVSEILSGMWDRLTDEEQKLFHEKSQNDTKRYDKEVAAARADPVRLKTSSKIRPQMSVRDMVAASSTQPSKISSVKKKIINYRSECPVPFSLSRLKSCINLHMLASQDDFSSTHVLAFIPSSKAWACYRNNELCILNCHRLSETILYHRLLFQHHLTTHHCHPISLTPRILGDDLWPVLEKLALSSLSMDTHSHMMDMRITANGFDIKYWKDKECNRLYAEIVGLCGDIPTYGVPDLKEVLELITTSNDTSLAQTRPLKVINYLKSEAVRMARQQLAERSPEEVEELLAQAASFLPATCKTCLHDKPFFHTLLTDLSAICAAHETENNTSVHCASICTTPETETDSCMESKDASVDGMSALDHMMCLDDLMDSD